MFAKFKLWIIIGVLISAMAGGAFYYYKSTQEQIQNLIKHEAVLESNNAQLLVAAKESEIATETLRILYDENQKQFKSLQKQFSEIQENNLQLREKLADHDLQLLAFSKPELVERVINEASTKSMRCFEILSGSPLTNGEKNAKSAKEFNSECPWLFSDSVN